MNGDDEAERVAAVERLGAVARAGARDGAEGARDLDYALRFLEELDLRTLREIDRDLARTDSLISRPASGVPGLAAFLGGRYAAALPSSRYHSMTPVAQLEADLLDTLVFREILLAHGDIMFHRAVRGVRNALGLPPHGSLATTGFARCGALSMFLLLDVAVSLAGVQLSRTSAHITASMGYSGIDAYAGALDNCHFMTTGFARYLLRHRPGPDRLVAMMARGRLDAFGISPTDLDKDRLRAELSKLRDRLPVLSDAYSSWQSPKNAARARPPATAGRNDDVRLSFAVSPRPGAPRTAGEAAGQQLSRRDWTLRVRNRKALLATVSAAVSIALSWWSALAASQDPSASLVLFAGLMGAVAAIASAVLLDSRAGAFFQAADGLSDYTVLQGRRDAQFLGALRVLRPDVFAGARHAGLPRLVTVVVERNGVLFLGRGTRPRVVASFHWLHVPKVIAPADPSAAVGESPHRVAFEVRRCGADVVLGFPLERAKVAWTQRDYLVNSPLEAVLSGLQGLRYAWALRPTGTRNGAGRNDSSDRIGLLSAGFDKISGTPYEREALDWEFSARTPLELRGAFAARREQAVLGAVSVLALGCVLAPPLLFQLAG
ncbi:hypothetical protein [Arthrobacter sp. Br18]|uniref:hypothetical protein n=1 Tax=Arthrobacter sp. Br18 TaxID=1312954 RepID=UPI00047BE677|nr:hypothetical protein [Arthrobacter sp. Br18]